MKKIKKPKLFVQDTGCSSLSKVQKKEEENVSFTLPFFLIAFILLGVFVAAEVSIHYLSPIDFSTSLSENSTLNLTTNSIATSSTTTSIIKPSMMAVRFPKETTIFTTSSTTTTLKCGGDWEPPCETESGLKCNPQHIIGSEGLCHTLECAPSVPSGKEEGCGGWALQYCQGD